jgi:hypothetical protein
MNIQFFIDRANEPSSWRGFIVFLTAIGVKVSPEWQETIIALGLGIAGLIGMLTKDKKMQLNK